MIYVEMLLDKFEEHFYFPALLIPGGYEISLFIYYISYETNRLSAFV